jgi:hypothetical protein
MAALTEQAASIRGNSRNSLTYLIKPQSRRSQISMAVLTERAASIRGNSRNSMTF